MQASPSQFGVSPRRFSNARLAFFRSVEWIARLGFGCVLYRALHLAPGRFVQRVERLRVPGLPPALEGFTLAHLSDFHAGPFVRERALRHVVRAVLDRRPDACVLTGDFVTHHHREARLLRADLAELSAALPAFAVLGNHDYKGREEDRIVAEFPGVRFLRNESATLERGGARVTLVGLEDLEEGRVVDLEAARRGVRPGDVELCLCHNPLGAPRIAETGCRAVLSGHSHGGQIDAPFLRSIGPVHPGLRVELGATTLIVSRGLGAVGVPLRFRAPAEVVYVVLERGDAR